MFLRTARRQYEDPLLFSTVVALLAEVVNRQRRSVNAAYLAQAESIGVSVKAVYDKLARTEPAVSEQLVRDTAADLATVVGRLHAQAKPRRLGRVETGVVYETPVLVEYTDGSTLALRQATVRLDAPTRDGEEEVEVLTNLPRRISGRRVARLYRQR